MKKTYLYPVIGICSLFLVGTTLSGCFWGEDKSPDESGKQALYDLVGGKESFQKIMKENFDENVKIFNEEMEKQRAEVQKKQEEAIKKQAEEEAKNIPKTDKPVVELFVMSHCPYGTQAEKGILPVVNTLKDKIDFKVKFVHYTMHGAEEIKEQMYQSCIMKEQPSVYLSYLACFLKASDTAGCTTSTGVDKTKADACVTQTDAQYGLMAKAKEQNPKFPLFEADNTKYTVKGSPTLVINGMTSSVGRDPQSYLKGICNAFTTPPAECATELSSETPSSGFGYGSASAETAAGCAQ